jgi:hypothetical protein
MTVKQFLQEIHFLNKAINADLDELSRLRSLLESAGPPKLKPGSKVKTGVSEDRFAGAMAEIIDLEAAIMADIRRMGAVQKQIREMLQKMSVPEHRLLLQERYINSKSWEKIALILGFSWRHTMRVHAKALKEFEEKYKDVIECHIDKC